MPLHTYTYACGCRRYIQGRECECFLNELLNINSPSAFVNSQANYLPFNMESFLPRLSTAKSRKLIRHGYTFALDPYTSCRRHNRRHRSRYDCLDHIYRAQGLGRERLADKGLDPGRRYSRDWNVY